MINAKNYIKILLFLLIVIFLSVFIYAYYYSKFYPIPLTHRLSLDAKLMFVRDMPNKETIDTIIVGSSMGLNNIHSSTLENTSKEIKQLLNLSAFSLEITQWEQIWELLTLFPNVKRVIYSTQSLDFTQESILQEFNLDFAKEYTKTGKNSTNFIYSFYTYKHILSCIKRHWNWKRESMDNTKFSCKAFDTSGGVNLHIYGNDIDKNRWDNLYAKYTTKESYSSLARVIQNTLKKDIQFYVVIQPYREILLKENAKLRYIIEDYYTKVKETTIANHAKYLNLNTLHLDDMYFADRIHLNDKGNIITAKEIAKFIDEN